MTRKLEAGMEAVGFLYGLVAEKVPAYLHLDARGAVVSIPQESNVLALFNQANNPEYEQVPDVMCFRSTDGMLILAGCMRTHVSTSMSGLGLLKIRARSIVHGSGRVEDYGQIDGMTSEIDGLASWAGMSTVTRTLETNENHVEAFVLRAENQDNLELGGQLDATVVSSFTVHTQPKGNLFGITDLALLRTGSNELRSWSEHAAVHHMFQDLMCLAYGRPCLSRLATVKREDDQPQLPEGEHRRLWSEAYEPDFGRSVDGIAPLDRARARPLFYLDDADSQALRTWIDEWDYWFRPTWIAVTTMFQRGTTVEATLLQIGVALEALGYAIRLKSGVKGKTPSFASLLEQVTRSVRFDGDHAIYGSRSPKQWRDRFNSAFRGAKHADNDLPAGVEAYQFATQGMNLLRAWTAIHLGVDASSLGSFDTK